ncbi:MAG: tRNA (adenosine(37)-N6)-threonylcarbamoyltransferase complex dimerization subunit type 1 TsaB [Lachnospiraceae bacterium]|nr:tRNA (adenosine(37)-N6)-threonylcarbamoyltransferase complex dimerization subunit type 1 TsaB [Lachnospiraceae bacterium]
MKILAVDSSGLVASVAIVENENLLAEYTVNYKKTHSQTLMPMLDEIVKMTDLSLDSIDAIAVAGGPGSFTGLRIGSATVKGLGLALNKPIVNVPTIDGLAYNMWGSAGRICPIMDARRNQVYTGVYHFVNGNLVIETQQMAIEITGLIEALNQKEEKVTFLGDGVPVYEDIIKKNIEVPYAFAPAHLNKQRASAIGALACVYYKEGRIETAAEHEPEYLRLSQAERERLENLK